MDFGTRTHISSCEIKNEENAFLKHGHSTYHTVSDRLCTLCSQDNVEDEYHFLLHCLKYSSLRTDFFNNIGHVSSPLMSDLDCIKFLLTHFPRQTAIYINSAYMYRQSLLYRKRYA